MYKTGLLQRVAALLLLFFLEGAIGQSIDLEYPGKTWKKASPEALGWSSEALGVADDFAKSIRTDAYLVIHKGQIVHEYGNISRATNLHSVRKSVLSVLTGIYVDKGVINLDKNLDTLGVEDRDSLTATEKQATVRQLLQARSGIYHRSAYEDAEVTAKHPARGSFAPGERFEYNNWDFNALGTIFKIATGKTVFDSLADDLAQPLQFEDFSSFLDTKWVYERALSQHPAYVMRMSARDLGRIGLLMARGGHWKDSHIISERWVAESTSNYSNAGPGIAYGYLWWVGTGGWHFGQKFPREVFSARGSQGQFMVVDPLRDLVVVHRVNTDNSNRTNIGNKDFGVLLGKILAAGPNLLIRR